MNFEFELAELLQRKLFHVPEVPKNLAESIGYSVLAGGKRFRPRLAMACGKMLDLSDKASLGSALAIELIHCFTLIHDDLPCMDDDDFRRGKPSNHKAFGEGLALLAGDALIPLAYEALLDYAEGIPPENVLKAIRRFSQDIGTLGVIGGQSMEMLFSPKSSLVDLERMHQKKTGALFSSSLLLPRELKGLDPESSEAKAIYSFGAEFGAAFQVLDDCDDEIKDGGSSTSILFHMLKREAKMTYSQRLKNATESLGSSFGEKSANLCSIATEILDQLR